MRTTITLEPDVEALLQKLISQRNLTFKQAVNFAIREGLTARKPFVQPVFDMGECLIPGDWSIQALADASEDKELLRKMTNIDAGTGNFSN